MFIRGTTAAFACALTWTSAVTAQTLTFSRDDYGSYAGARAIATADFDRNGWPDLAQANTGRNTVTILLNQRDTGLTRAFDVAVGAGPFDLTTGDYNRDGIPDLAVANADGHSISILLGKGDGSFTRHDIAAPAANPRAITTADVNKDAKLDLIYSGYANRTVQVLLGDGAGGFTKGATYVGSPANPQGLATADFNHDGYLDIALAYASEGGLRILYSDRGTGFSGRTIVGDTYLNVITVGDFNRDGWEDVAAASTSNSTVGIYLGSATGPVHAQTYSTGASPRGITAADVNDDGLLDIITANRASSTVSVLLGDRANPGRFQSHLEVGAGSGSRGVVASDFNADGRMDLATGNEYASAVTVLSNETAFERAAYVFREAKLGSRSYISAPESAIALADFDRDGTLDVATSSSDARGLSVMLPGHPAVLLPVADYVIGLAAADFNADGNPDLLYLAAEDSLEIGIYRGNGHGAFTAGPITTVPLMIPFGSMRVDDMNRDGRPDLVFAEDNVLRVMCSRSDGTFTTTAETSARRWTHVAIADLNRDGTLDVATVADLQAGIQIWWGDGKGGLAPTPLDIALPVGGTTSIELRDVNRDAYVDIVVPTDMPSSLQRALAVLLGGSSGFSAPIYTPIASFVSVIALGDLNVDGIVDVVLDSGDVLVGDGDGSFTGAQRFDFVFPYDIEVEDFTGDGLPDILVSTAAGQVVLLANERNDMNQPPIVDAGPDRTFEFSQTAGSEDCPIRITAIASDPDAHALTYEWRDETGTVVSTWEYIEPCRSTGGPYEYSIAVSDGRGGVATDTVRITVLPTKEIVLWTGDGGDAYYRWESVPDQSAAGGERAYDPNLGAPKVTTPLANPTRVLMVRFAADPTQTYKLWIRMKADNNYWANDSVWVQFSGSTDVSGTPAYRTGTTSGLAVSLEECSNCGVSGWGWADDGWGAPNTPGVLLRFPVPGDDREQYAWIQTREDGVSIDQIVLSAEKYLTTPPGPAKNDNTILPKTYPRY